MTFANNVSLVLLVTDTQSTFQTRDLAPKAKVLRCHHRHALWGGVACQWGGTFHGGSTSVGGGGMVCQWRGDISLGGLTLDLAMRPLVLQGASMGGKPKVSLLVKPLELQYYFTPFSKAAKYQTRVVLTMWGIGAHKVRHLSHTHTPLLNMYTEWEREREIKRNKTTNHPETQLVFAACSCAKPGNIAAATMEVIMRWQVNKEGVAHQ